MREVGSKRPRRGAAALAASLLAHAALLVWLGSQIDLVFSRLTDAPAADLAAPPVVAGAEAATGIALVDEHRLGELLLAPLGHADQAGFDREHPLPSAEVHLPGHAAAARGGSGGQGGPLAFTGRRDRDQLRSQIWNGLARYQVPHLRTAERSATPEELARAPETGFDGRTSRTRRARAGAASARSGEAAASGRGGRVAEIDEQRIWELADPRLDTGPSAPAAERQIGSTEPGRARALIDRGQPAVETERRADSAADADSAAAASNERDPMPLELTRASAGGRRAGVRGRAGRGAVPGIRAPGAGTAATRMNLAAGSGVPAVRAHREDPYFRRMYQRLDRIVVYPRERALALDQGEVVVAFTLFANGSIGDLRVLKSSGFGDFDGELTRALRVAAPFGPVPLSLRGQADRVGVTAPYKFKSPLIR